METERFIIISEMPVNLQPEFSEFRRSLAMLFSSTATLAYPPHVTLRTGLLVPPCDKERVFEAFADLTRTYGSVPVQTTGLYFSKYDNERFLAALRIAETEELMQLNRLLLEYSYYRKSNKRNFIPHITLLFEDLDCENWYKARTYLESMENEKTLPCYNWEMTSFGFYRYEGSTWVPDRTLMLEKETVHQKEISPRVLRQK